MTSGPDSGGSTQVDELRQRLRALGYLDAGVDRFVLAGAHGSRGPAAVAALASLRIGLIGALVLGPAAALGIAARLPGLAANARDVAVLALYTAVAFGIIIAIAAAIAALIAGMAARRDNTGLARRARPLSLAAGIVVGLATLVYLSVLWTSVTAVWGPASGLSSGVAWPLAGFALIAGVSLLIGHVVTLTTLAVIVAGAPGPGPRRGIPASSWRTLAGGGALAFAGALLVFALIPKRPAPSEPPRLTVVPNGNRVRVLALDGIDTVVVDRMAREGLIPNLAGALAASIDLSFDDDPGHGYDPARVWTTVATGRPPSEHGVEALETRQVAGVSGRFAGTGGWERLQAALDLLRLTRPALASGGERRVRTFWEVAESSGLRTAVVNWWATWPAPADGGIVLTDRAALRLERGGPLDAEIAPAPLFETLRRAWPEVQSGADALTAEILPRDVAAGDLLRRAAHLDATTRLMGDLVVNDALDLFVEYFPGADIVRHTLLSTGARDADAALPAYYAALDRLLAPALTAGDHEVLIVITSAGRSGGRGRLSMKGPAASEGSGSGQLLDVAPTILYALGLPLSREMTGQPALALFTAAFRDRYAVRYVREYGRPDAARAARSGQPLEQEMIDRLRSLGYVR